MAQRLSCPLHFDWSVAEMSQRPFDAKYQEIMHSFADTEAARDAEASIRSLKTKIG